MNKQSYTILISLTAALGGLLFGFDFAIFSGTIPFLKPHFQLTDAQLGWTSSCIYVGCMAGTLIAGYLSEHFGRKKPLIVSAIIFAISALGMATSQSYYLLVMWRVIAGLGVGGASMLSPLYIAEVCPAKVRGRMVSINQLTIVIGILLAYLSSYLLINTANNWRWMFASAGVPAFVFFVCGFFLPESPRWLIAKNREPEGEAVLEKLIPIIEVPAEINTIRVTINKTVKEKMSDLFKPGVFFIVMLGVLVAVFSQLSGANIIFIYAPIIFEKAGMDIKKQLFQQIMIGSINLLFTLLAMRLVDSVGRRRLMITGAACMTLLLFLIGAAFYFNMLQGPLVTILVLIFIAIYATTLAPVTWVLISEIFPNRIRGMAMSAATTMLWIACFAVTYVFPILVGIFQKQVYVTFWIFAGVCTLYFLFLLKYIPETKGRSLEEIEKMLVN